METDTHRMGISLGRYAHGKNQRTTRKHKKVVVYPWKSEAWVAASDDRHRFLLHVSRRQRASQNQQQFGGSQPEYQGKNWYSPGTHRRLSSFAALLGYGVFSSEKTSGSTKIMGRLAAAFITQSINTKWRLNNIL